MVKGKFGKTSKSLKISETRNRRDRDKNGGGLIEFVRKGSSTKKIKEYETKVSEIIAPEFTISKKK